MATLGAQRPAEITPGVRVRARLPEAQYPRGGTRGHLLRGRVTTMTADTLYLAITDSVGPLAVPRSLIERLDYSRGVPSRASSAAIGFSTGAVFGGLCPQGRWKSVRVGVTMSLPR
jgi:hypothetical protein